MRVVLACLQLSDFKRNEGVVWRLPLLKVVSLYKGYIFVQMTCDQIEMQVLL